MTIQDLGSIGEFVAAIATLITLVYLALQIRQNTKITRAEMFQHHALSVQGQLTHLGSSAHASRVFNAGLRGWTDLAEDEQGQFSLIMAGTFQGFQSVFWQYRSGLLAEDLWQSYQSNLSWYLARAGVREWWKHGAQWVSEPFAALVTDMLAELDKASSRHG